VKYAVIERNRHHCPVSVMACRRDLPQAAESIFIAVDRMGGSDVMDDSLCMAIGPINWLRGSQGCEIRLKSFVGMTFADFRRIR
jgi:hypothetical protein